MNTTTVSIIGIIILLIIAGGVYALSKNSDNDAMMENDSMMQEDDSMMENDDAMMESEGEVMLETN